MVVVSLGLLSGACGGSNTVGEDAAPVTTSEAVRESTEPSSSNTAPPTTIAPSTATVPPSTEAAAVPRPPEQVGSLDVDWIDGWYIEIDKAFAAGQLWSGSADGDLWAVRDSSGANILWDLGDGAVYLVEDFESIQLSGATPIAVGRPLACSSDICSSGPGARIVDTDTGEFYEYDVGFVWHWLASDGSAVWFDGLPEGIDGETMSWSSGRSTTLYSLLDRLGRPEFDTSASWIVGLSRDGGSVLYKPLTFDGARESQLLARLPTGEVVSLWPPGEPFFVGGAAFSADGESVLIGADDGLAVFDLSTREIVVRSVVCDADATGIRNSRNVIALDEGRWVVALTPPDLSRVVVAIVNPLEESCDIVATIPAPHTDTVGHAGVMWAGGTSRFAIRGNDYSERAQHSLIVDLDERPVGAVLVNEAGVWSVSP